MFEKRNILRYWLTGEYFILFLHLVEGFLTVNIGFCEIVCFRKSRKNRKKATKCLVVVKISTNKYPIRLKGFYVCQNKSPYIPSHSSTENKTYKLSQVHRRQQNKTNSPWCSSHTIIEKCMLSSREIGLRLCG